MNRPEESLLLAVAASIAATACGADADPRVGGAGAAIKTEPSAHASTDPLPSASAAPSDASGSAQSYPCLARLGRREGEQGARNILLEFGRAIELREFGQAYAMLGQEAQGNLNAAQFRAPLTASGDLSVSFSDGRLEGAGGSLYYVAPIRVAGSDGTRRSGTAILRRVNDVDGASQSELRWHIYRFALSSN